MKIIYISHYFSPEIGAPSARIHEMARAWINAGHEVEVVTGFPNHPHGELYPGYQSQTYLQEELDGIKVHRVWTYITPNSGLIRRTLGHISLWISTLLFAARHIDSPDAIIGTSPTLFSVMAAHRMALRKKVPFVMEVRDLWPGIFVDLGVITNPIVIKMLENWELWLYRQADRIVPVTEGFKENMVERGILPQKIHTIPNGADLSLFQPGDKPSLLARDLGLEGKTTVLYLGAHGISHGLESILDAAAQLKEMNEVVFLFVGDGSNKEHLLAKAERENLDNVIFHPPITKDQVPMYYNLADICLVPLRDIELFQTFIPSKMFEIMAMGKPIIASLRGEAAEILKDSGGALIAAPENVNEIVKSIKTLYNDPVQRARLGQNGRRFVEAKYSRKILADRYISLMQASREN